jgi:hypothetical protein
MGAKNRKMDGFPLSHRGKLCYKRYAQLHDTLDRARVQSVSAHAKASRASREG